MQLLSVVICTTGRETLKYAINSVREQAVEAELIIVADKPLNVDAKVVTAPKGLSTARNKGVKATSGKIILFMDDDVILPHPKVFSKVIEAFDDEEVGVYGVQVKPLLMNSVLLPDKYNWIYGCTDDNAVRPVGAFFAVRREVFREVGLFREDLGRRGNLLSGEETEFFVRAEKAGWKVILDNSVRVYHLIVNRNWDYILRRCFYEGLSKALFNSYDYGVEFMYLLRFLRDFPLGLCVVGTTCFGFIAGRLGRWLGWLKR